MNIKNHIARITAAIILIFSLLAVTGVVGEINPDGAQILNVMIGISGTFLFVAQTKAASSTG